jgi:hypothetical protein
VLDVKKEPIVANNAKKKIGQPTKRNVVKKPIIIQKNKLSKRTRFFYFFFHSTNKQK